MSGFDWPTLMQIGVYQLRLKPHEFWSLTPLELTIIFGFKGRRSAVMTRASLMELHTQFPDDETE